MEISEIIAAEDKNIPADLLILSCEDDQDFCLPFINKGNIYATFTLSELLRKNTF